jgi:hypothetical protein
MISDHLERLSIAALPAPEVDDRFDDEEHEDKFEGDDEFKEEKHD